MNNCFKFTITAFCLFEILFSCKGAAPELSLKDSFREDFYMGVALNQSQIQELDKSDIQLIDIHFNSIVAENCMKSEHIQPQQGVFDFSVPDKFVKFGESRKMFIVGHNLVWHSQLSPWFLIDKSGNEVSRDTLIARMHAHISTIVGRYKDRVHAWDVVNEAVNDDGSLRESGFLRIIGKDYIKLAFQFAHEADPDAELYYNDYSMALEGKRNGVIAMVKELQSEGIRIDGIGMQGHLGMDFPKTEDFEKSIIAFSELGVKVMITELDMSVLPSPWSTSGANISDTVAYTNYMNPYPETLPAQAYNIWEARYLSFFKLFLKHSDKISRVTFWGLNDDDSWKNDWPIVGRKDYPLWIDRNNLAKPIIQKAINLK